MSASASEVLRQEVEKASTCTALGRGSVDSEIEISVHINEDMKTMNRKC